MPTLIERYEAIQLKPYNPDIATIRLLADDMRERLKAEQEPVEGCDCITCQRHALLSRIDAEYGRNA